MSTPIKNRESIPVFETGGGMPPKGKSKLLPAVIILIVVAIAAGLVWKNMSSKDTSANSPQAAIDINSPRQLKNNETASNTASEAVKKTTTSASKPRSSQISTSIIERGGIHLAGVRTTFESAGWTVNWMQTSRTAIVTKSGINIKITPGLQRVTTEKATITAVPAPLVRGERLFLPVSAIQQATNGHIFYDKSKVKLFLK